MISPGPAGQRAWRDYIWVFPAALGAAMVFFLSWSAWRTGYSPGWLKHGHAWWHAVLRPDQSWTLAGTVALCAAGLASFWWPRRSQRLPIALIIVVVMVAVAAVLGEASYIPCRGGMSVAGVTFWVLQLFVGQPPNVYQPPYGASSVAGACAGAPPPALQLAQTVGLGATVVGAVAVGAVLWREPVQRLRSRFTSHATVFTGLDTLTLPVLRLLTAVKNPRTIIVIEPDETNPLLDEARATGARVIMGDPASAGLLRPIITGWRGSALDRLYALSARVPENDAVIATAGEILEPYPPAPDRQAHLVARVDDPRHADAWRGKHSRAGGWFEDALSPAEATARTLISQVLLTKPQRLIICGDASLTLAILAELARRAWEQAELIRCAAAGRETGPPQAFAPAQPSAPAPLPVQSVTLLDLRAAEIRREYRESTPKEILKQAPAVDAEPAAWQDKLLGKLAAMPQVEARQLAVIIADGPDETSAHQAGRVARLHQKTPVFVLAAPGAGMDEAIFDRLHPFELGLLTEGAVPEDSWTRVARHWHECYRLSRPVPPGDPKADARRPWADLTEFLREDNILQVRSILAEVAARGRKWVPVRMVPSGSHIELGDQDIAEVASREHARWRQRHLAHGLANDLAVPWTELPPQDQQRAMDQVRSQLGQLAAVGFLPTLPPGGPPGAASYERTGIVRASRLTDRLRWRLRSGEEMHGNAGDWHVVDDAGNERTVADPEFKLSHEELGNGRWRRTGVFRAWRVTEKLKIWTKEGEATAYPGDWIVEGPAGERWPLPNWQFEWNYRRIPDGPRERDLPDQASTPAATSSTTAAADSP